MTKKVVQEINAGSMADIAFLLLIFFLVTTTMSNDLGIIRKLPPIVEDVPPAIIKKRNMLNILVNRNNRVMVKGEIITISELKPVVKEFIQNPNNIKDLPEVKKVDIPGIGDVYITPQHIISLMNDRGTNYKTYITVQNELAAAYNELREEFSIESWGIHYLDLDKSRKKAVDLVYPLRISEAEPVEVASLN